MHNLLPLRHPRSWLLAGLLGLLAVHGAAADSAVEARLRRDVTFLASDACEGRGVSTKGINLAADYIAAEFKNAGLRPAGSDASYFQPFSMRGPGKLGSPNILSLRGPQGQEIPLKFGEQFLPLGMSSAGKASAPLVFAGYGITAAEAGYNDYKDLDVAGKVVVILRKTPRPDNAGAGFDKERNRNHAALTTKMAKADLNKAAAVLFVNDRDTAKDADRLMDFQYTAADGSGKIPAVHVHRSLVDALLRSSQSVSLREVEEDIDRELKPRSLPLTGWTADLDIHVDRPNLAVKNVVGVVEGAGRLAHETLVIGAHYDHLGYGGSGSLARNLKAPAIHHGADDNASGTTVLLELARRFAQPAKGAADRRRLVFIAFSAEESGLLGSVHYCKNPLFPLADTAAMINLDMVGRMQTEQDGAQTRDKLVVYGTGTAKTFDELIESVNQGFRFKLRKVPSGFGPSDHASFYEKQIPVYFLFTGDHGDYHRPSDTADKINITGMERIANLVTALINHLQSVSERPQYVKIARTSSARMGGIPRLGIRPSYGDDQEGVLLGGVSEGGPAAKAGLKEGDRIVAIGGKPVKNLEGYMALLGNHKRGEALAIVILRDGKKQTVEIKPE